MAGRTNRRVWRAAWVEGLAIMVFCGLLALAPVRAQEAVSDEPVEAGAIEEVDDTGESDSEDLSFEDFLNDDEIAAEGYAYDPAGRRDPFKSLLLSREGPFLRGPRPPGVPGLLIDEVDLTGIFITQDGPVAQVVSTEQENSFLLREGDQLYDGDVVSITGAEIVFRQIVNDPAAIKPFREVVKKLNP